MRLLIGLLLASGLYAQGYIQSAGDLNSNAATSFAVTFSSSVTAGHLIFVTVSVELDTTATAADTVGSSYTQSAALLDPGATFKMFGFWAKANASGANTVTVTFGGSAPFRTMIIAEYAGIPSPTPADGHVENHGTAGAYDSGALTTTKARAVLLCGAHSFSSVSAFTPDAGWTQRNFGFGADAVYFFDQVVSATGTYHCTGTTTGTRWLVQELAFSGSGGLMMPFVASR